MPYINDIVFDSGLVILDIAANRMDICSGQPLTYNQATSTFSLGYATGISVGSPADASPDGRQVTISAVSNGITTASGNAAYWSVSDTGNSRLLAAGAISNSQVVASGNSFTMTAINIRFPDA